MTTKETAVILAVNKLKTCPFKATAIKVELEAQLNRDDAGWDTDDCYNFLMERLAKFGLAQQQFDWKIDGPLKFAYFYDDGSVDSEFTFTLSLKKPQDILLLPKIIEVWNELCAELGQCDTEGAGMHMALLNSKNCVYPSAISRLNMQRFFNFKKSMQLLMPALFFLASPNETSRPLEYRRPAIEAGNSQHGYDKFNAIWFANGALEFRVFETCYERPEAILDNVIVMSNCMRYWRKTYVPSGLSKITPSVGFGNDKDYTIKRFYTTVAHIDLLNAGLTKLKPSYYSIRELKDQRNFHVTKTEVNNYAKQRKIEAEEEYKEYEERFGWSVARNKHSFMYDRLNEMRNKTTLEVAEKEIEIEAQAWEENENRTKASLEKFVEERVYEFEQSLKGGYTLQEG